MGDRQTDLDTALGAHRAGLACMELQLHAQPDHAPPELPVWLQLTPVGPLVQGRDGRAFEIKDPATIIEQTQSELPLLVDRDHASMWGSTEAAAWVDAVEYVEADAISAERPEPGFWGHVEKWTPDGALDVREYRYRKLSPVIRLAYPEAVEGVQAAPYVVGFEALALTNRPNLRMVMLHAEGGAQGVDMMDEAQMAELLALLGLEEGADGAAILAAVAALAAPEKPEEPAPEKDAESHRLATALRVSESALASAREQLAAHAAQAATADRETQTALVDVAIKEGRALAAHRDDLVRLAVSERAEDRATFARLTEHAVSPRGRVTSGGEVKTVGPRSSVAALGEFESYQYKQMTAAGLGHDFAMKKIAESKVG